MAGQIVVGVDGSAPATAAVEWAVADARRRGRDLRIVHVCEQWPPGSDGYEYCVGTLEAAADRARGLGGGVEVTTALLPGTVATALITESETADSLVLGSRGLGGFAGMVVGSVGMAVAGHARGPVVVVRAPSVTEHGRIVVGDDGSEHAAAAMRYALEQARARHTELHVVHGWQMPAFSPYAAAYDGLVERIMQEEIDAARQRVISWREQHSDLLITDEQVCDHPVSALIKASETADLVVVGSRGLGGFASAVLGSVGHGVLHHVTCPVAVVRPRRSDDQGPATP
ncbi:universal stress protein [Nonomuraea glycinis]|uniref:Universal stress protein n=1 Tax=Nonomuraea glycinis TaxID=2047744 RepID=A0A918E5H7_9ACTN|nr:universal stress protein [Nonomuraea glycinis]MCA2178071.1 universal stress protein [Nonomuraea glycinis]GGP06145.1 universal stress protein [Nonomuraea glycinis]